MSQADHSVEPLGPRRLALGGPRALGTVHNAAATAFPRASFVTVGLDPEAKWARRVWAHREFTGRITNPAPLGVIQMRNQHHPAPAMLVLIGAVALVAGACSGGPAAAGWTNAPAAPTPNVGAVATASPTVASSAPSFPASGPPSAPSTAAESLSLTILSDTMTGKVGWPVFLHSDFQLPAHSTVIVTVINFDNATALPKNTPELAKASGIVDGSFTVTPIVATDPNGSAGPTRTETALDPGRVSHTFSLPALGINVPIAPNARTTFTFQTGSPCACQWHCLVPCGTGANGYGGPMAATSGYMEGTLTVS